MRAWLVLAVAVLVAGCFQNGGDGPATTTPTAPTPGTTPAVTSTPVATTPAPGSYEPRFDGQKAYEHVVMQVTAADGTPRYRVPGTQGNTETAEDISGVLRGLGYDVQWHHFNASYGCVDTPMHNVVAQRNGTSGRTVVFAAHYDTRPVADKDPDPAVRTQPILGANDGASGVAVLLELARVLPPSNDSVRLLFFDGEDGGGGWKGDGCRTEWILGSTAYAASLSQGEVDSIRALVLVDMIGDHDLKLPKEGYTAEDERAAPVQEEVYRVGQQLGHDEVFLDRVGPQILDDHMPFLARSIPAIDLIHLVPGDPRVFPSWHHTLSDDLDAVSAQSLEIVGETLETWFAGLE